MAKKKQRIGEKFDMEIGVDTSVGNFPEGIHRAKCVKAEITENKAKDGYNLVLDFTAVGGEYDGRRIRNWLSLKETVRWKLTEALNAFGAEFTKDSNGKPKVRLTPSLFVGKEVRLQVTNEDYMGEQRPSVDKILEPRDETEDDVVPGPLDDSDDEEEEEDEDETEDEEEEDEDEDDDDSPEADLPF